MTIALEGREVSYVTYWVHGCSDPETCHLDGGARCARKGGRESASLVDARTGEELGCEFDEDTAVSMVSEWGWRPLGGGIYLRPTEAARVWVTEEGDFSFEDEMEFPP